MHTTAPKKYLIFAMIFFALSLGVFTYLYMSIKHSRQVFLKAEEAWQREENRLAEIRNIDRSIKTVSTEKTLFESHFANKSDIVPFLDTLEKLAISAGAKAEVASVDSKDGSSLSIALRATGSFESLYKLLNLLEQSRYQLKIEGLDLQRESLGDASTLSTRWRGIFQVKLLSYVE